MRKITTFKEYINGNCTVKISDDGTKIREFKGKPKPEYPESIDLKITDQCDGGCAFCHEQSTPNGEEASFIFLTDLLKTIPPCTELAIGGGNPLSYSKLRMFLDIANKKGIICNMTMNQKHATWCDGVQGIGVSYVSKMGLEKLPNNQNLVIHLIAGVHHPMDLDYLIHNGFKKFLILGYKKYGNGKKYYSERVSSSMSKWFHTIEEYLGKANINFDNLAIRQLNLRRFFSYDQWKNKFMGDDGQFTMYIDAVKQEYAISSTSERKKIIKPDLREIFNNLRTTN